MNAEKFKEEFDRNFAKLKDKNLVLYGVGEYTKLIVECAKEYTIIGLMDKKLTGEIIYGLPVLSQEEAAAKAEVIIIAASLSVGDIIYSRIRQMCLKNRIEVYWLNGLQPYQYDTTIGQNPYWSRSYEEIQNSMTGYDVISFDIFDTLVMRICSKPEDIFDMVEQEAEKEKQISCCFAENRKKIEYYCYREITKYFTLDIIYEALKEKLHLTNEETEYLKCLEWQLEKRFIVQREGSVELLKYALKSKKKVILTSDMYLGAQKVKELLEICGILDYDRLFVSCDIKCDKWNGGIWDHIKEIYPDKRILHIGDNEEADIKRPRRYGIDTIKIASAKEILKWSGIGEFITENEEKLLLGDKLQLGLFMKKAMNNPFALNKMNGKLQIKNMYDFGYLFFGPLVLDYLLWLIKESKRNNVSQLLFAARDGYLLKILYEKIIKTLHIETAEAVYFLTSRRVASVAAIESETDIAFVMEKLCTTTALKEKQVLTKVYGIKAEENDSYREKAIFEIGKTELTAYLISRYGKRILENAKREREGYNAYINKLHLGKNLGFVNFVCQGVSQYCIEKILKTKIQGFYFAAEDDIMELYPDGKGYKTLYQDFMSTHTSKSHLASKYLFGEAVLSAPQGQLVNFEIDGTPNFDKNINFELIEECHTGIEDYIDTILVLVPNILELGFNSETADKFFGIFSLPNIILGEKIKSGLQFHDSYGVKETVNLIG